MRQCRREVRTVFLDSANLRSCKIGTVPALVVVHGGDLGRIAPDRWIRG